MADPRKSRALNNKFQADGLIKRLIDLRACVQDFFFLNCQKNLNKKKSGDICVRDIRPRRLLC